MRPQRQSESMQVGNRQRQGTCTHRSDSVLLSPAAVWPYLVYMPWSKPSLATVGSAKRLSSANHSTDAACAEAGGKNLCFASRTLS